MILVQVLTPSASTRMLCTKSNVRNWAEPSFYWAPKKWCATFGNEFKCLILLVLQKLVQFRHVSIQQNPKQSPKPMKSRFWWLTRLTKNGEAHPPSFEALDQSGPGSWSSWGVGELRMAGVLVGNWTGLLRRPHFFDRWHVRLVSNTVIDFEWDGIIKSLFLRFMGLVIGSVLGDQVKPKTTFCTAAKVLSTSFGWMKNYVLGCASDRLQHRQRNTPKLLAQGCCLSTPG